MQRNGRERLSGAMPVGNSMSRKLVLLSVGHIWRREPTRRRVVSWRVGPSSSTRKTRAPFELWRCAAVLPTCGIAQINEPRPGCLGPSGDIARDRRELTHCARVFLTRDGSTSRPLRQPTTLRVSPSRPRRRGAVAGRVAGRAPFGVSPPPLLEKRREAEACAAVCREVTRTEALPEAGLVDRSDVANR